MKIIVTFAACLGILNAQAQELLEQQGPESETLTSNDNSPQSPGITEEKRNIADILNYSQISIEIITEYNNRVVLDREYSAILNNFNLRQIPDERIVALMTDLMDCLVDARLTDREREMLDIQHARKLKAALPSKQEIVRAGISTAKAGGSIAMAVTTGGTTTIGAIANSVDALDACGSVAIKYLDYQDSVNLAKEEKHDANWDIDNNVMKQVNEINKTMLSTSWSLYNEYEIPEAYRLTQSDISSLIKINRERDLLKRHRLLSRAHMKDKFSKHAPYWYYLGSTAHEIYVEQKNEEFKASALKAYREYENTKSAIFKKDELLASCILGRAQLLDPNKDKKEVLECLQILEKSPPENWPSITTMALLYARMGMIDQAKSWAQHNVDLDGANVIMHKQMMGRIFANLEDYEELEQLASAMFTRNKATVIDVLDMIGGVPNTITAKFLGPQVIDVSCNLFQKKLREDVLVISAPFSLHVGIENVRISGGSAFYDPESGLYDFKTTDSLSPENIGSSGDKRTVLYEFKTSLVDKWIKGEIAHIKIEFYDSRNSVAFLFGRQGIGRLKSDSIKETTKNSLGSLMSLDPRDSQAWSLVEQISEEDSDDRAITANVSLVTINNGQYFIQKNSLVEAKDELRKAYLASVLGIFHQFAKKDKNIKDQKSDYDKYRYIIQNGDKGLKQALYRALLEKKDASYLTICALFGRDKDFIPQLKELPFSIVSLEVGEDLGEKAVKAGKWGLRALKKFKVLDDDKSDKLKNNKHLELSLPSRWAFFDKKNPLKAILQANNRQSHQGEAQKLDEGDGAKFLFVDSYNATDWSSAKVSEVMVVIEEKGELVILLFEVRKGDSISRSPSKVRVGKNEISL